MNSRLKLPLISLVSISAFTVAAYFYYYANYSWDGSLPSSWTGTSGWSEKKGVIISETIPYYRTGSNIIMDEHMNFIRIDPYCDVKKTFYGSEIEIFDFDGQTIRLERKCYGPSKVTVWSPISNEGKNYLQAMLSNGKSVKLKRAVLSESQERINRILSYPPLPPKFSSKGYSKAIFNRSSEGQYLLEKQKLKLQKIKKEKEKNWEKLRDNAL